jgi:nucleoid DNA-binding protein
MENNFNDLPEIIKTHLESVTKTSGLPYNQESVNLITANWLEKKKMFEEQTGSLDMIEIQVFNKGDARGALLLTYSGSLISVGPLKNGGRHVEYSSIKLRQDVPDIVILENTDLAADIAVDRIAAFTGGKIKSTSNLLKIVVCKEDVSLEEQEKRIREATIFLTNGFVILNRTLSFDSSAVPDHFTLAAMVKYIAAKNGITQVLAKQVLEDFLYMVECGVLLGQRVSLGRLGNMILKKRAAQKARIGINPATGEEITIKAKPEMYVPKISFSKALKEKAAQVKIQGIAEEGEEDQED